MKKLGIVIPTYNRCFFLKDALDALIPQIVRYSDIVSILICDNRSTDKTKKIVAEYVDKYPNIIEYYCHQVNKGYFYNFKYGIEKINSEYIFLHGDDDIVTPYFIDYILSQLNEYPKIAFIHFNYFISKPEMKDLILFHKGLEANIVDKYDSGYDFIKHHMNGPSFMTSNVFSKDCWNSNLSKNEYESCYGYEWLYIIYNEILEKQCLYIGLPLVIQRMSKINDYSAMWPLYYLVGLRNLFKKISSSKYDLEKEWKKQLYSNRLYFYMTLCMVTFNKKMCLEKRELFMNSLFFSFDKFLFRLLLFAPKTLGKLGMYFFIALMKIVNLKF